MSDKKINNKKDLTPFERSFIELYAITGNALMSYIVLGGRESEKMKENAVIPIIEDYSQIPIIYKQIKQDKLNNGMTDKQLEQWLYKEAGHAEKLRCRAYSVQKSSEYLQECLDNRNKQLIADKEEILQFYTAVMRGQVLDQFGIEASLDTRIKSAQELAKWQIELPLKLEIAKQQQAKEVGSVTLNFRPRAIEG